MRWRRGAVVVAALGAALAAALVLVSRRGGARAPASFPAPRPVSRAGEPRAADFVGAEVCASCHAPQYAAWRRSTHGRAGGPPGAAAVIAPFGGRPLRFADAVVAPAVTARGEYVFTVAQDGRPPERFRVDGVIGGGHMVGGGTQAFVSRYPDGTLRVLPFEFIRREGVWFCNTNSRTNRGWVPITPDVRLAECGDWPPARVIGDVTRFANCQACHGSQIATAFDPAGRRYDTRFTALAVNCESCHGPGRRHVELARSGRLRDLADIGMRALGTLGKDESAGICFQCHALKDVLEPGYLPGKPFAEYYALGFPQLGDRPLQADGRVRTFAYQEGQRYSDCYVNGSMTCVDCHDPHTQGYRDVSGAPLVGRLSDGQCTGCHASKAERPGAHTHHRAGSPGSRCVSCHMPYLQEAEIGHVLRYARSDHTIPIPRPAFDAALGIESACRQCHADQPAAALDGRVREWWGELKPRAPAVAALVSAGEIGDRSAAARLLLDPDARHPAAQFAALGEFLERYLTPDMPALERDVVDRLERLAAGGDGDVRSLALASLHLARGNDRAVRGVLGRQLGSLGAAADAVRKRWVVALGFVADGYRSHGEPSRAIVAYRKALEIRPADARVLLNLGLAYADAGDFGSAAAAYRSSLEADPHQPLGHVNWGIALAAQGDTAGAVAEFRRALDVDPSEPLAHFNLGAVALARGRPVDAVAFLRQAAALDRSLAPAHFALARAYLLLADWRLAGDALRRGLEFDPGNAAARQALDQLARAMSGNLKPRPDGRGHDADGPR